MLIIKVTGASGLKIKDDYVKNQKTVVRENIEILFKDISVARTQPYRGRGRPPY